MNVDQITSPRVRDRPPDTLRAGLPSGAGAWTIGTANLRSRDDQFLVHARESIPPLTAGLQRLRVAFGDATRLVNGPSRRGAATSSNGLP